MTVKSGKNSSINNAESGVLYKINSMRLRADVKLSYLANLSKAGKDKCFEFITIKLSISIQRFYKQESIDVSSYVFSCYVFKQEVTNSWNQTFCGRCSHHCVALS